MAEDSNYAGLHTVEQMAERFRDGPRMGLVITPEGTRGKREYWKSGFYRIAQLADVPIVCAYVDKTTRSGGFGPVITPSGDVRADMDLIRAFYADKHGIKPGRFAVPRLREEDTSGIVG